ncbi:MAG: hypothetical protein PHO30_05700, partial [Candidatus Omnitrophica bacterium]|nr:hypothetical protein [Candidatus Omnitrophota bacterium]
PALPQVKLINGQTHTLWLEGPNMEEWSYRSLQMSDAAFIRQVIEWTLQVSEAAVMLNAAGIEHGDIQPGNVVIWRNRYPVLKDFEDECFFDRQGIGHLISVAITARELVRASQGGMATVPAALMLDAMHQRYDRELLSIAQAEYASVLEFNEALRAYYRREYRKDFATPGFDQIKPALLQMNQLRAELYRARIIEGSI